MSANCTLEPELSLNFGQTFFITVGMIPFLLCLPPWIVAKFVWQPMELERQEVKRLLNEKLMEYKNREIPYDLKYPLISNITSIDPKINNIIIENTPMGYVAMRYNQEEAGFEYWTDKNVLYSHLETVARKYVNTFCCAEIYIDRKKHLKDKIQRLRDEIKENLEAKKKLEEEQEKTPAVKVKEKENVFASLKKYNTNIKIKTSEKEELTKDDFVCDTANKYIQKGKFIDSKKWVKAEVKTSDTSDGLLHWLSWKKQRGN